MLGQNMKFADFLDRPRATTKIRQISEEFGLAEPDDMVRLACWRSARVRLLFSIVRRISLLPR